MQSYVATRKGLFIYEGAANQWRIKSRAFSGDSVSAVLPLGKTVYAALNLGHHGCKLHRSDDDGTTWHEVAVHNPGEEVLALRHYKIEDMPDHLDGLGEDWEIAKDDAAEHHPVRYDIPLPGEAIAEPCCWQIDKGTFEAFDV